MRRHLSIALLVMGLVEPHVGTLGAQEPGIIELAAPRLPSLGEAVDVQVTTGPLPQGARLALITEQGDILGVVAPFGTPAAQSAVTAALPLPRSALVEGHVRLKLEVLEPGVRPRSPRPGEVRRIDLVVVPASH
jgi:hypothetical protein